MSDQRDPNRATQAQYDERLRREIEDDDDGQPTGSCDNCDCNVYPGDDYGGLCSQCAWYLAQSEGE